MKTIILRDIQFIDRKAMNHAPLGLLHHAPHMALDLLPEAVREWCEQNGIHPDTESYKDMTTLCLRLRVYATVPDPLATYYMLRWGQPCTEEVYT